MSAAKQYPYLPSLQAEVRLIFVFLRSLYGRLLPHEFESSVTKSIKLGSITFADRLNDDEIEWLAEQINHFLQETGWKTSDIVVTKSLCILEEVNAFFRIPCKVDQHVLSSNCFCLIPNTLKALKDKSIVRSIVVVKDLRLCCYATRFNTLFQKLYF